MPKQETIKGGLGILSCTRKEGSAQKSNRACTNYLISYKASKMKNIRKNAFEKTFSMVCILNYDINPWVIRYSWNLQKVNKLEQQLTHNCTMFLRKLGLDHEFKQFDTLIYSTQSTNWNACLQHTMWQTWWKTISLPGHIQYSIIFLLIIYPA